MPSNLPSGPFEKLGILFKMTLSDVFFRINLVLQLELCMFFWGESVNTCLKGPSLDFQKFWGGGW